MEIAVPFHPNTNHFILFSWSVYVISTFAWPRHQYFDDAEWSYSGSTRPGQVWQFRVVTRDDWGCSASWRVNCSLVLRMVEEYMFLALAKLCLMDQLSERRQWNISDPVNFVSGQNLDWAPPMQFFWVLKNVELTGLFFWFTLSVKLDAGFETSEVKQHFSLESHLNR